MISRLKRRVISDLPLVKRLPARWSATLTQPVLADAARYNNSGAPPTSPAAPATYGRCEWSSLRNGAGEEGGDPGWLSSRRLGTRHLCQQGAPGLRDGQLTSAGKAQTHSLPAGHTVLQPGRARSGSNGFVRVWKARSRNRERDIST